MPTETVPPGQEPPLVVLAVNVRLFTVIVSLPTTQSFCAVTIYMVVVPLLMAIVGELTPVFQMASPAPVTLTLTVLPGHNRRLFPCAIETEGVGRETLNSEDA